MGGNLLGDSYEHGITNDLNQFSVLIFTSHEPFRIALERKYESRPRICDFVRISGTYYLLLSWRRYMV